MSKKLTTEEYVEKVQKIHGDKYDYSSIQYDGMFKKIKVICKKHGVFEITAHNFICGKGCKKCFIENNANNKRKNKEQFIEEAKQIHGDKYDYSKVDYVNCGTKVCIICHIHGEFWQTPNSHLHGNGCKKCSTEKLKIKQLLTLEEFIERARKIHGNKYDYSKVEYNGIFNKVCIVCSIHGEFWQTPHSHLQGNGCSACKGLLKLTTEQFIEKARQIHGNKYDYSKVEYINNSSKVTIICPIHGEFKISPNKHLMGQGCKYCNKPVHDTKSFIEEAIKKHGNKYDYSKVEYVDAKTNVCIICPKHGEFWQTPSNHLHKYRLEGCPKCQTSKLEEQVMKKLNDNKIEFEYNKYYDYLNKLQLDFYIPSKNIAIECQGLQHFENIKHFGGTEKYNKQIEYDKKKYELCKEKGIKLLYYSNKKYEYWDKIYTNIDDLFSNII